MNTLETLFKVGVVRKNVPNTLNHIKIRDEDTNKIFQQLLVDFEYEFIEYLVINTYEFIVMDWGDGTELDQGAAWARISPEDSGEKHELFIELLNGLLYNDIVGIDIDFENETIELI